MATSAAFQWPLSGEAFSVLQGVEVDSVKNFRWIVIVGGILAFAMAWGIGANDVANAFATSVGAGSISLRWACVIAAVMEFLGAFLMGANVTDTVRKKIIQPGVFDPVKEEGATNGPELLMAGFLVALITATSWLIIATYFALPVSTTHSIIGSLIGVGLAYRGGSAVVWISDSDSFFGKLKGVVGVVASWFISPILSGIIAMLVFLLVRTTVLRSKNPVRNGFIFLPFFYTITFSTIMFFLIYKGSPRFKLDKKFNVGEAVGISLGIGAGVGLLSWWFVIPFAKGAIDRWEAREIEKLRNPEAAAAAAAEEPDKVNSALQKVGINLEVKETDDEDVIAIHENVEKFDAKAEQLFTWLQVFTAAFDAFAHGANDVANSIGPFASIYQLYTGNGVISAATKDEHSADGTYTGGKLGGTAFSEEDDLPNGVAFCGEVDDTKYYRCSAPPAFPFLGGLSDGKEFSLYNDDGSFIEDATCFADCGVGNAIDYSTKKQPVELWILALGGIGIVAGLAMWGYRIIVAIGTKLTKLTPSRGFSIEIGAAITVIIASRIGLPVSTTHCQVGATVGVGLIEFKKGTVNWKQFGYICLGWVFTVLLTGLVSAGLYSILIYTPLSYSADQEGAPGHCPGQRMFYFDTEENGFRGVTCSGF